jgi:hypothetical protein
VHVLQLDPQDLETVSAADHPPKSPPPRHEPDPAVLTGVVVDAQTREPLQASIELAWKPEARSRIGNVSIRAGEDGLFEGTPRAGTWYPLVRAENHVERELPAMVLVPGGKRDLGTVCLELLPRVLLRILDEEGLPEQGTSVSTATRWGRTRDDGTVELRCEVGTSFVVTISEEEVRPGRRSTGSQAIRVSASATGNPIDVAMRAWHDVEIGVEGIDPELSSVPIGVFVESLDPDADVSQAGGCHAWETAGDTMAGRRYSARLAAGCYRARLNTLAFDAEPVDFTIGEQSSGTVKLTLSAR